MTLKTSLLSCLMISTTALLSACGGDDSDKSYQYRLEIINLTNAQPLSPAAIILHEPGYELFNEGESASLALEVLAESGDLADVLYDAQLDESVFHSIAGETLILPGESYQYSFSLEHELSHQEVTIASMLVNTNDAFTGINQGNLTQLDVNQSQTFTGLVWDAGTEKNSETSATIPGPAGGGQGFNASRDDLDKVVFHSGIVSLHDGLESSVLTEQHRFNQPASLIRITRTR